LLHNSKDNKKFIHAAQRGDLNKLKSLLQHNRIPKMTVEIGLKKAIISNKVSTIKYIFSAHPAGSFDSSALAVKAAQQGKLEILKFLIETHGANTFDALKASLHSKQFTTIDYLLSTGETTENLQNISTPLYHKYEAWKHQKNQKNISENKQSLAEKAKAAPITLKRRPKADKP